MEFQQVIDTQKFRLLLDKLRAGIKYCDKLGAQELPLQGSSGHGDCEPTQSPSPSQVSLNVQLKPSSHSMPDNLDTLHVIKRGTLKSKTILFLFIAGVVARRITVTWVLSFKKL
jgi:hypothetical protein